MQGRNFGIFTVLLVALLAGMGATADVYAGAWAQEQGKGLAILNYRYYWTNTQFSANGMRNRLPDNGQFRKSEIELYLEYGILPNVTLLGSFYFDFLQYQNNYGTDNNAGFSDQKTGVRYQFSAKPVHQSVEVWAYWPAYNVNNTPSLGNGYASLDFRYYIGNSYKIGKTTGYYDLGVGFLERFGPPADQIQWWATVGVDLTRRLELQFHIKGEQGLGDDTPQYVGDNITLTTNYQLVSVEPSLIYKFDDGFGLQAGPTVDLFGANTGAGLGFKVALWKSF